MITQERLKQLFDYNPLTGKFIWKERTGSRVVIGSEAGTNHNMGYIKMSVDGREYLAHRLAWLYVHGVMPLDCIDHINHDRSDNRISNLRQASRYQNQWNVGLQKNNTSGYKGIHYIEKSGRWRANLRYGGKSRHLGTFETAELACEFLELAREMVHGDFANNGVKS